MMYWIRDSNGDLVNLARANAIVLSPPDEIGGDWSVDAYFDEAEIHELRRGSKEACRAELEILHAKLTAAQANVYIAE